MSAARVAALLEAIARAQKEALRARAHPLTPPQARAMEALVAATREGTGLTVSELSGELGLAHSTVSGIVDRLERDGLVRRTPVPGDRRFTRIEITGPVRAWLRDELPALRLAPLTAALERATAEEQAAVIASLELLARLLESAGG